MKQISFVLLTLFLYSCSNKVEQTETVAPENPYSKIRTGKFKYLSESQGDLVMVARQDSIQKEFLVYRNLEVHFDIKWLNDSTYKMRFKQVAANPENVEMPDDIEKLIKYCDVLELTDSSYVERAYSSMTGDSVFITYQIIQ